MKSDVKLSIRVPFINKIFHCIGGKVWAGIVGAIWFPVPTKILYSTYIVMYKEDSLNA